MDKGYGIGRVPMSISMFQDIDIQAEIDEEDLSDDQNSDDDKPCRPQSAAATRISTRLRRGPNIGALREVIPEDDEHNEESWNERRGNRSSKKPKSKKATAQDGVMPNKANDGAKQAKMDYFLKKQKTKDKGKGDFVQNSEDRLDEGVEDGLHDHHMNNMMEEDSIDGDYSEDSDDGMLQ